MPDALTGDYLNSRIRYALADDDDAASLRHCRRCQRATGGVAGATEIVALEAVRWVTWEPDRCRSVLIAWRDYHQERGPPYRLRPVGHFAIESRHEAWLDISHLPGKTSADSTDTRERWIKALGKLPD